MTTEVPVDNSGSFGGATHVVECPLCPEIFETPAVILTAPGVAAALGVPADALASMHAHQQAQILERRLHAHLVKHTPEEWLPALMEARARAAAAEDAAAVYARRDAGLSS